MLQVSEALAKDDTDLISIEDLETLTRRGHALSLHPDVDKVLAEIDHTLKIGQSWEEKASICLQARLVLPDEKFLPFDLFYISLCIEMSAQVILYIVELFYLLETSKDALAVCFSCAKLRMRFVVAKKKHSIKLSYVC